MRIYVLILITVQENLKKYYAIAESIQRQQRLKTYKLPLDNAYKTFIESLFNINGYIHEIFRKVNS